MELADTLAEMQRNVGIEAARNQMREQTDPSFDGIHCIDCEEAILPGRLALKRMRCAPCQTIIEVRMKVVGR